MARTPVRCALSLPAKGLAIGDNGKVLSWGTIASGTTANRGYLVEAADDTEIAGLCVVVDKNLDYCTLHFADVLRLPVADTVTLANVDIGKKVLGGADGTAKPVSPPDALDPASSGNPTDAELTTYNTALLDYLKKAKGQIIGWNNTTGNKWVDVIGYFG